MTNREFYKEEILDIVCRGIQFAFDKDTNRICECNSIPCGKCLFKPTCDATCIQKIKKWCNEKYVEPCPFEKDELVEVSQDGIEWVLGYFSHDTCGLYFTYANGWKSEDCVSAVGYKYCRKYGTLGGLVKE